MPLALDYLKVCSRIANVTGQLTERGLNLSVETDFDRYVDIARSCDKMTFYPMFDPSVSDVGPHNGFWIHGTNSTGDTVHLQAARLDVLNDRNLADFLESLDAYYMFPRIYRQQGEYCRSPACATRKLAGRIVYQGEFWLKGGRGGTRGRGLPGPLMLLSSAVALARWDPDYTYAMVQPRIVRTGMARQYGYTHMEPHGILWHRPGIPEYLDEWVIWRGRRQLIQQVCAD